jgi:hypothetical protein
VNIVNKIGTRLRGAMYSAAEKYHARTHVKPSHIDNDGPAATGVHAESTVE